MGNLVLRHQALELSTHHRLEKGGTQGLKVITCSAKLSRMRLCCTYQLAGITGEEAQHFRSTNRRDHVQKNTLSDRKHLLNPCLIITQWQYLCILQCPRGLDQPVSGTWEAKSETSQNSCLLRYLLSKSTECLELEFGTNATWLSPRESSKKLVEKCLLSKICSSLRPLY